MITQTTSDRDNKNKRQENEAMLYQTDTETFKYPHTEYSSVPVFCLLWSRQTSAPHWQQCNQREVQLGKTQININAEIVFERDFEPVSYEE